MRSEELLITLLNAGIKADLQDELWWPNSRSFEVIVGAILVQNTAWKNAQKALDNLKNSGNLTLERLANLDTASIAIMIKPSGFYNTKAKRLSALCKAIYEEFGSFESFKQNVSREWLLDIRGIGAETCDAILCYACEREVMCVDSYALRILAHFGYEFQSYEEAREWLEDIDTSAVCKAYGKELSLNQIFARYHGKIVEFGKAHFKGKKIDEAGAKLFDTLR
ncbi:3-methyladenine DNA glycosylase [Campylobacter sp. RM16188]|uniref:3-methyladenine DNA glycosylase n=1 Tax=Campylobacter sp. RM16188 TaxID=1705725 RepID=UPI001556F1A1|nr:3-methyladenine DNA glycosylase [Campylobacter sp. RM16188]